MPSLFLGLFLGQPYKVLCHRFSERLGPLRPYLRFRALAGAQISLSLIYVRCCSCPFCTNGERDYPAAAAVVVDYDVVDEYHRWNNHDLVDLSELKVKLDRRL